MSKIEVDAIDKQSGSTLTLGGSGTAVTLACGATQTGFGRTGTVDWQTTPKTSTFTAVNGEGYFVNTSGGAVTVNLPASPSGGDIVAIKDYAGTASTNIITVARNGSNIRGEASDFTFEKNNSGATFIYVDATEGWQIFVDGSNADAQATFICATGGTETTCGNYKIHTFTGPGTFTVSEVGDFGTVDYLVIAGGGSGGLSASSPRSGGGGAGGYRFSDGTASGCYSAGPAPLGASALPVCAQAYPITVGGGGAAQSSGDQAGNSGSNSVFNTITSTSGGGGGGGGVPPGNSILNGGPGGSGGAAASPGCGGPGATGTIGVGNTPPVSPPQGNSGGLAEHDGGKFAAGGGGGGAGAVGGNSSPFGTPVPTANAGAGGNGLTSCITGSPVTRAGGGGGNFVPGPAAPGGTGGGGAGNSSGAGTAGTTNTGSGGGAGAGGTCSGAGGSGIVIIRYKIA